MEHTVEALTAERRALSEQVAGAGRDPPVGQQVGRRRELVGQRDRLDALAGQQAGLALGGQEGARQPRADEAGAARDQELHVMCFR